MITTDFRVAKKVGQVVWIGGWYELLYVDWLLDLQNFDFLGL